MHFLFSVISKHFYHCLIQADFQDFPGAVQTLLPGKPDKSLGCNLRRTRIPSKRAAGGIGRGTNLSSINWRKVQENELPGVCNLIEVS